MREEEKRELGFMDILDILAVQLVSQCDQRCFRKPVFACFMSS